MLPSVKEKEAVAPVAEGCTAAASGVGQVPPWGCRVLPIREEVVAHRSVVDRSLRQWGKKGVTAAMR
jgi:hypothetical protein